MKRHEEGITLIALIITIIILIILTAITISNLMGSNLFGLAKGAAQNYIDAGKEEQDAIDKLVSAAGEIGTGEGEDNKELEAGLYSREGEQTYTWQALIDNGYITEEENIVEALKDMEGKLVIREGVTEIKEEGFSLCKGLFEVVIPNSLTTIGDNAFMVMDDKGEKDDSVLEAITVKSENIAFKSIDGVLFSKSGKTLIQYPINKSGTEYTIPNEVTSIGSAAFAYQYNLETINIGSETTKICQYAFSNTKITTLNFNQKLNEIQSYAFKNTKLTKIKLPESVNIYGSCIFIDCANLVTVEFSDTFPTTSFPVSIFYNCSNLTTVKLPINITKIGSSCFYGCSSLTTLDIPQTVTVIDYGAFYGCTNLSTTLPLGLEEIGEKTFYGNLGITSVPRSIAKVGNYAFDEENGLDEESKSFLLGINKYAVAHDSFGMNLYTSGIEEKILYSEQI